MSKISLYLSINVHYPDTEIRDAIAATVTIHLQLRYQWSSLRSVPRTLFNEMSLKILVFPL